MNKEKCFRSSALRRLLFAITSILIFSSCGDKNTDAEAKYNPDKPIVLTTFMPLEGGVRDKILLSGQNFGTDPSKIKVYFNSAPAPVIGTDGEMIYAMVPRLPGEICNLKVTIGDQSAQYDETFTYHSTATVSTITGNGTQAFKAGTLAEAQVYARYICVDAEDNIFASVRDAGTYAVVRINESENIVTPLILSTTSSPLNPNGPSVDLATGIVTVPDDPVRESFFTFDPKEGWAPRQRTMQNTNNIFGTIDGGNQKYKYAMAFCAYDGHVYTRYRDGHIVKMNPETYETAIVYKTNLGPCYGMAFSTSEPNLLYMTFENSVAGYGNNICTLDVSNPTAANAFKVVSSGLTGRGHKDGPLETAIFNDPRQICFDPDGNMFIADYGNHCIRMMSRDKVVETILGQPGTAGWNDGGKADALFKNPWGLAVGIDGSVYISDYGNARIRKLTIE